MKLPARPPSVNDITLNHGHRLFGLFERLSEIRQTDRYLHWNDIRRRPAPTGLNHEDWWWILKTGRSIGQKGIPLKDRRNAPFVFGIPDQLSELLHEIDRQLGYSIGLPAAVQSPAHRDQYIVSSLIQESITSSQLEGAATTRQVAKEMLRTHRPPRDRHERMILNNYRTMQRIRDLRDSALSPELVLELQTIVTKDTLDEPAAAGRFRRADETIRVMDEIEGTIFHDPPPAEELEQRMKAMCSFANAKTPQDVFIHPVIRAIILHFWLAYDHPFVDGNGRTARALFYWSMLQQRYELFEFISISQIILRAPVKYGMAFLHTETDDNDLTYFILHQAKVIQEAVSALHDYVKLKTQELSESEKLMRGISGLNHRQQALLCHALREPHTTYTIIGHKESHRVTHQTARTDLFDLVERGLLTMPRKIGRTYRFRASGDLEDKILRVADSSFPVGPKDDSASLDLRYAPPSK